MDVEQLERILAKTTDNLFTDIHRELSLNPTQIVVEHTKGSNVVSFKLPDRKLILTLEEIVNEYQ